MSETFAKQPLTAFEVAPNLYALCDKDDQLIGFMAKNDLNKFYSENRFIEGQDTPRCYAVMGTFFKFCRHFVEHYIEDYDRYIEDLQGFYTENFSVDEIDPLLSEIFKMIKSKIDEG